MAQIKCKNCGTFNKLPPSTPSYMLTFGDLNTLLLTFFVLLITMSTTDIRKFNLVLSSFRGTLGVLDGGETVSMEDLPDMGNRPDDITEAEPNFEETADIVTTIIQEFQAGEIDIVKEERGIVIQVTENILFRGADFRVSPEGEEILQRVALLLNTVVPERQIRVEGHTDNVPIPTRRPIADVIETNWELSSLRASNVVRVLERKGVSSSRLSAVGYGAEKPVAGLPDAPQTDEQRDLNRRVDIVVLSHREE